MFITKIVFTALTVISGAAGMLVDMPQHTEAMQVVSVVSGAGGVLAE